MIYFLLPVRILNYFNITHGIIERADGSWCLKRQVTSLIAEFKLQFLKIAVVSVVLVHFINSDASEVKNSANFKIKAKQHNQKKKNTSIKTQSTYHVPYIKDSVKSILFKRHGYISAHYSLVNDSLLSSVDSI